MSTYSTPSSPEKTSFPKSKIKIVLLENIHNVAIEILKNEGFQVKQKYKQQNFFSKFNKSTKVITYKESLKDDELIEVVRDAHVLGIRSKTKLTKEVLREGKRLLCIGCFCIGTDQVDLDEAEKLGVKIKNESYQLTNLLISFAKKNKDSSV